MEKQRKTFFRKYHEIETVMGGLLCIMTSFWVLRAPKSWSKHFFSAVFNLFCSTAGQNTQQSTIILEQHLNADLLLSVFFKCYCMLVTFFFILTKKDVKTLKMMILTSKHHVKHPSVDELHNLPIFIYLHIPQENPFFFQMHP